MQDPQHYEERQRRNGEIGEGHRREHERARDQQAPPPEEIGQRAGRQLHEDARERRRAHHEPDEGRSGAELAREEGQQWCAADRV